MKAQRIMLLAAAFAILGSNCLAQSSTNSYSTTPDSMSNDSSMGSPDHTFIMKAAQGGLAEVVLGNLAQQNGGNDSVKQFGERMVKDHSLANDELRQLAQQKGITLPADVSTKDHQIDKMLESKQGADFDRAYIHDMVRDHETDIAEFRREAENGKDPAVKAWAQKTLPTLEQHLAAAKQVAAQVGVKQRHGAMQ
jgi:putative membrane protein